MKDSVGLAERDLQLVEALQVAPRAPWADIGAATGTSAVTAARRWQQLTETGSAWITGPPGVSIWNAQCVAYVEVTCAPGQTVAVGETLARDRHALSVELTVGNAGLFITAAAADLSGLSRYLLGRVDRVPGVTATRTRIATRLYRDGSQWRLGALSRRASQTLTGPEEHGSPAGIVPLGPVDRAILIELGRDGRASYASLAQAAEVSETTARRRVTRLLQAGAAPLRTEVAAPLAGLPVSVTLLIDTPTSQLEDTARAIARLREVRLCATVSGTPPMIVAAWLHDLEEIHRLETSLARDHPGLTVADRLVTLRTLKRMGRLLDENGRAIGVISIDVWADPDMHP